ncbi:hypothetical protein [Nocardia wallacei]|uniref:hypothetical protein n=1 Tax=Nocardia wallacei TaxID=480035 RepID=UPI0024573E31|nr:hypothetical protein [Nocardia wallacei]
MFDDNGVGKAITQRLAALVAPDGEWRDHLWRIGTLGALEECLSSARSGASLTRKQYVIETARRVTERDPAITGKRLGRILSSLPKKADSFSLGSSSYFILEHEVNSTRIDYFELWDAYLGSVDESEDPLTSTVDITSIASYIAASLRSYGFSDIWIVKHCSYYLKHNADKSTLRGLLSTARTVQEKGSGIYTYLVPLRRRAAFDHESEPPWLSKIGFETKFAEHFPGAQLPSNVGGLMFEINALEKHSAYDTFLGKLSSAIMRSRVAASNWMLDISDTYWVTPGDGYEMQIIPAEASLIVIRSLDSDGGRRLLQPLPPELEAALDLLSNSDKTSARSACVTSWAMVETLFADSTDFGSLADIADRAADLLTCMYVADLLLGLAKGHTRVADDQLSQKLGEIPEGQRIAILVGHLAVGGSLMVGEGQGLVSLQEARRLVGSKNYVHQLRNEFSESLRRLYDTRNQIVHAGVLEPYAMNTTLLVSSKLLAAILDEVISSSFYSEEPTALLAAKCRWLLNRVEDGPDLALLGAFRGGAPG